jgi:N-acetyl-alpha-D-glucosaminyl L-malate synthase BshA
MKIAITGHPTYGGSGVVAAELAMALANLGHEVHFISYQVPFRLDPLHPRVTFHGVEVTSYPLFKYPPYDLALSTRLLGVVREHGVRRIHAHYAIPHSIAAILARQMCLDCGVRVVTTLHGTDITLVGSDPSFFEITRFAIDQSDAVTAVSEYLARASRDTFRLDRPVRVIPNFIDPQEYSPERRRPELRRRFAGDDEVLFCHISNFRPVKRIPDVIDTFARVARVRPARLLMIGNGPEAAPAHSQAAALGVLDRITWLGALEAVAEPLACADLFLLPSDGESFGLAALEAMASGVPGIATRTGGIPEVIDDGRTGILRGVGDTAGMAEGALELLAEPDRFEGMRVAARASAIERYSLDRIVDRYVALYAGLG